MPGYPCCVDPCQYCEPRAALCNNYAPREIAIAFVGWAENVTCGGSTICASLNDTFVLQRLGPSSCTWYKTGSIGSSTYTITASFSRVAGHWLFKVEVTITHPAYCPPTYGPCDSRVTFTKDFGANDGDKPSCFPADLAVPFASQTSGLFFECCDGSGVTCTANAV